MPGSEPSILGPRNEEELRALVRALAGARGFTLILARCDDLRLREEIAGRVRRRKALGNAQLPDIVELTYPGRPARVHKFLASAVKERSLYSALFLYDLDRTIAAPDDGIGILHELNLTRDFIKNNVPHALVIWLPREACDLLVTEAPDLWAWRAAELDFAPFSPARSVERDSERRQVWELSYEELHEEVARLTDLVRILEGAVEISDVRRLAGALERLGDAYGRMGESGPAIGPLERALGLYREIGSRLGGANCIQRLGDIALRRSDHAEARRRYEEALPIYEEFGDPYSLALNHLGLARLELSVGHLDEAGRQIELAEKLALEVSDEGLLKAIEALRVQATA